MYCDIHVALRAVVLFQINLTKDIRAPKEHRDDVSGAGRVVPRAFRGKYRDEAQFAWNSCVSSAAFHETKASARREDMLGLTVNLQHAALHKC